MRVGLASASMCNGWCMVARAQLGLSVPFILLSAAEPSSHSDATPKWGATMVLHHTGCTPSSLAGGSLLLGQIVAILLAPWGPSPAPISSSHSGTAHHLPTWGRSKACTLLALGAKGLFCEHQVVEVVLSHIWYLLLLTNSQTTRNLRPREEKWKFSTLHQRECNTVLDNIAPIWLVVFFWEIVPENPGCLIVRKNTIPWFSNPHVEAISDILDNQDYIPSRLLRMLLTTRYLF